jgi:hypothetical protein
MYTQQAPWIGSTNLWCVLMVATRAHDARLTKGERYEVCQWHGSMYALATAAESGMKAGKRKCKSGMPTRNTHTQAGETRQNPS